MNWGCTSRKSAAKKEEGAGEDQPVVKKDEEESNDESDDEDREKEDIDVRDVRYKLEPLRSNVILFSCSVPIRFEDVTVVMVFNCLYLFHGVCRQRRTQLALKERNLRVRNVTWTFSPDN